MLCLIIHVVGASFVLIIVILLHKYVLVTYILKKLISRIPLSFVSHNKTFFLRKIEPLIA